MGEKSGSAPVDTRKYRTTLEITFEYDGERIRMVRSQRLEGIAPASPFPAPELGKNSGFWVEMRDGRGRPIFYRILHNPVRYMAEEHLPDGTIHAVAGPPEPGSFDVLLPDMPEAASIALFSSPFDMEHAGEPAVEIAEFPLKKDASGKEGQP